MIYTYLFCPLHSFDKISPLCYFWSMKKIFDLKADRINTNNLILIFTLLALVFNLWFFWKQNNLTQVLNQPICAVKEVKVNIDNAKDIEISAVIVNSGNYIANNASIEWEFYHVKDLKEKQSSKKIEGWVLPTSKKSNIAIMPRHEFVMPLVIVKKEKFDNLARGYESGVEIKLSIEYTDMKGNPQTYRSSFLITRLGPADSYSATIRESSYEKKRQIEIQGKTTSKEQPASPPVASPSVL